MSKFNWSTFSDRYDMLDSTNQQSGASPQFLESLTNRISSSISESSPPELATQSPEEVASTTSEEAIKDLTVDTTEELAVEGVAEGSAIALSDFVDPVMAGIGAGMMAADVTQGVNQQTIARVSNENANKPGIGANLQSSMITNQLNSNASSMHSFMTAGALLGGPLGAALGYAFSPSMSASNLNFDTAYSSNGMVNPELQATVSSGFASSATDQNQTIMDTS